MGRVKTYDERVVLDKALKTFVISGYEGTSIDDLVKATGLLRGSLYSAYGSKLGIFLATLTLAIEQNSQQTIDLILIALLELSSKNDKVHLLVDSFLKNLENPSDVLGQRILERGKIGGSRNDK